MTGGSFTIEDTDLSNPSSGNIDYYWLLRNADSIAYSMKVLVKNCKLPTVTNLFQLDSTGYDKMPWDVGVLEFVNCYSGTDTDPSFAYERYDYWGECKLQETVTRLTTDGVNSKILRTDRVRGPLLGRHVLLRPHRPDEDTAFPEDATTVTIHVAHTGVGGGTSRAT